MNSRNATVAFVSIINYTTYMEREPLLLQSVDLTADAVVEARRLLANEPDPKGKALRVYVESGGCSGMQYGLVFDERREGDHEFDFDGVPVVVDSFSTTYLQGSVVDFSDDLNDGGFKVMIPGAKTTCGCGKSFEV